MPPSLQTSICSSLQRKGIYLYHVICILIVLFEQSAFQAMQDPDIQKNAPDQDFQLPEWETTARHHGGKGQHAQTIHESSLKERAVILFDHVMPAHRKYFGLSRNIACIAIGVIVLLLLALILGLAIGLSNKSRYVSPPSKPDRVF